MFNTFRGNINDEKYLWRLLTRELLVIFQKYDYVTVEYDL